MREVNIEPFETSAAGSVLISMGGTRVLCTASIAADTPPWIRKDPETRQPVHGWVSAEYSMLPGSTPDRKRRKTDGRSTEIQRLIGRSLRAAVDMDAMPGLSITVDCDVLRADGGTRTASITGGYVALAQAVRAAREVGRIDGDPIVSPVAAISVGVVGGTAHLDLDYPLDVAAEVDMNVVMNGTGEYIEVQGTGEKGTFARGALDTLLDLAESGCTELLAAQRAFLAG